MSWHGFSAGQRVPLENIVATCEKRIKSGKVIDVEGKRRLLRQIRGCGYSHLVFMPRGTGWGETPLNPNNWQTPRGDALDTSE